MKPIIVSLFASLFAVAYAARFEPDTLVGLLALFIASTASAMVIHAVITDWETMRAEEAQRKAGGRKS